MKIEKQEGKKCLTVLKKPDMTRKNIKRLEKSYKNNLN